MIWLRLVAAGITVFMVVPFLVWLTNGLVILIGGQLFFLFWFLPVVYCILKSIFETTTK
jgi:hypothetical protein|tara:strand:+ start:1350 stop:1526 length:177 start_codon:yes stop_codon:yes gene_type:complete